MPRPEPVPATYARCVSRVTTTPSTERSLPPAQFDLADEDLESASASTTKSVSRRRRWVLPVLGAVTLITGTADMLLIEMLNRTKVLGCKEAAQCAHVHFKAVFTEQLINGVGQACCLVVFYVSKWITSLQIRTGKRSTYQIEQTQTPEDLPAASPYLWVVPGLVDAAASIMLLYAQVYEAASSVQVLRTFGVIICAFLSVTYLHRDLRVFHWLGVAVMTLGLVLTGWQAVTVEKDLELQAESSSANLRWLGVALVLLSTCATVFVLVFQERLMNNYNCSPLEGVGWMGMWSTGVTSVAMMIAHFSGLEQVDLVWWQISQDLRLQLGCVALLVSIGFFTASGLALTKMGAALLTTTVTGLRQVPIWTLELAFGWILFSWPAFIGLFFTCIGFVIYVHLIPRRICSPTYEHFALREVRIRCSCHDEVSDDELTTYAEDESKDGALEHSTATEYIHNNRKRSVSGGVKRAGLAESTPLTNSPSRVLDAKSCTLITIKDTQHGAEPGSGKHKKDAMHKDKHHKDAPLKAEVYKDRPGGSRVWRNAVLTTRNVAVPANADSQTAWIFVRRSEEWVTPTSELPLVSAPEASPVNFTRQTNGRRGSM